jgi:Heterogeneous nuclear ribonucleoprotein Q acidic domain
MLELSVMKSASISSLFVSSCVSRILNRYMRGNANAPLSNKNRSDKGLGHYPQPSSQQQHQFDRNRERDRFAPSRDNIRTNTGTSSSSFRDQSRDRFDDRRDFGGNGSAHRSNEGHSASVMNNPTYDNRPQQQMPQQQQQAWQNQNFAHPPMQPQPMGAVGYGNYGASGPAPHMNNSMQPQGPPVNQGGMQPPGVNLNFAIPQQQPYYPQQQSQQQPPYMPQSQSFVQQAGYPPNPQQGVQSNTNVQYQQSHMGNMMGQQQQSAFGGNPSTPQSYMQQPMSTMNQQQPFVSNHLAAQQPGWRQPQEPPQLSIDILGLADKAASAIQALGANKLNNPMGQGYTPQLQHGGPSPPQQGYSSYGPMNQGQPSLLGMQQQAQQFPSQQQQQYPPHHQHQHIAHNSLGRNTDAGSQQAGRRRTTATLTELPVTVQYAVQNLVATGAIDGSPDEGIMGMIFDLPEHMALTALQKFASIDKSSMRNKTAYLAGVLRRELEKIHRR